MTVATLLLSVLLAQGHGAKGGGARKAARSGEVQKRPPSTAGTTTTTTTTTTSAATTTATSSDGEGAKTAVAEGTGGSGKTFKSKTYNFGAMDVEGKLKTPQLLYFLNRVKLELDMSAPDTRSFMKELEKSADDKNL
jgi:hypothetical protein